MLGDSSREGNVVDRIETDFNLVDLATLFRFHDD